MQHAEIHKSGAFPVAPHLADWAKDRSGFDWSQIEKELDGLPNGGLNLAHEAIDRHCLHGRAGKLAMIWEG